MSVTTGQLKILKTKVNAKDFMYAIMSRDPVYPFDNWKSIKCLQGKACKDPTGPRKSQKYMW